jgi:hypothetical protein
MTMTGRLKACDQSAKVFITKQESLTVFISGQRQDKSNNHNNRHLWITYSTVTVRDGYQYMKIFT